MNEINNLKNKKFHLMITGTPGTGKTYLSSKLANLFTKHHLNISKIAIDYNYTDGYDEVLDSHFINADKINDCIKEEINQIDSGLKSYNGLIIDYHGVDFYDYPQNILAIIVVTADPKVLKTRYDKRKYNSVKIQNNIEYEIFRESLEEAIEYIEDKSRVFEFSNNNEKEFEISLNSLIKFLNNLF